jgi:oligopeptidase B
MTGGGPVLLRVDLDAGHSGRPGRFEHLWELAEQYAFLLDLAVVGVINLSAGGR